MTLGPSLMTVKGFAATDTLRTFLRARELCEQLGDDLQLFRVLFGLSIVSVVRAEYAKACRFAEQSLRQAERANDAALLVQAHWVLGLGLQFIGDFAGSREHLERSVALYDPQRHAAHAFLYGAILNRMHLGRVLWFLGFPSQAQALTLEGIDVAGKMRHPLGTCNALSIAVTTRSVSPQRGEDRRDDRPDALPRRRARARLLRRNRRNHAGMGARDAGRGGRGLRSDASPDWTRIERSKSEQQRAYYLVLMAEAWCSAGRTEEGRHALDEAAEVIDHTEEHFCEAELYRIKGELLARDPASAETEDCFRRAIDLARSQQAKGLELRAATSLARWLHGQRSAGRRARDARAGLRMVHRGLRDAGHACCRIRCSTSRLAR